MTMQKIGIVAATLFVAGCVAHPDPIVDLKGLDPDVFATDLEECEGYANEVSVAEGAVTGAAAGAVIGAATGAISGNAGEGAGYGAIYGGTGTGMEAQREKKYVFARCLEGRGYRVLNY